MSGSTLADKPQRVITIHDGHVDIHQYQIGVYFGEHIDGLPAVPCMHQFVITTQQHFYQFEITRIILGNE